MTEAKSDGIFTLSVPVVMAFPNLLEAKAFKKNGKDTGEAKFSANFIFEANSDELKAMKILAVTLARAKWPDKQSSELSFPFISGTKLAEERKKKGKDDGEWMTGKVVIAARSKYEPRLSYIENGKLIDLETDLAKNGAKAKFYPGVEVLAQFNFVPYDPVGNAAKGGVTVYLNMVCSTNKGKRLSGGASASETFKGYVGAVSSEDPTAPGASENLDDLLGI